LLSAARQLWGAVVRLGRTVAAPVHAAGRWVKRGLAATSTTVATLVGRAARAALWLLGRVGAAVRVAAQAVGGVLRSVARAGERIGGRLAQGFRAIGRTVLGPIKSLAGVLSAGTRRVVRLLGVAGRELLSAAKAAGRHLRRVGLTIVRLIAAPLVGAAVLVNGGVRLMAAGGKLTATSLVHFLQWIWRPVAEVGRQARDRARSVIDAIRSSSGALAARMRGFGANLGLKVRAQWRRSHQAAQRVRIAARRGLREARVGVRRWAKAMGRNAASRSPERPAEVQSSPAGDEIPDSLGSTPPANTTEPAVARRSVPLRAQRRAPD
jgi:hypothetical protein